MLPFRTFEGFEQSGNFTLYFQNMLSGRSSESYPSNAGDDSLSNKSQFFKNLFL